MKSVQIDYNRISVDVKDYNLLYSIEPAALNWYVKSLGGVVYFENDEGYLYKIILNDRITRDCIEVPKHRNTSDRYDVIVGETVATLTNISNIDLGQLGIIKILLGYEPETVGINVEFNSI